MVRFLGRRSILSASTASSALTSSSSSSQLVLPCLSCRRRTPTVVVSIMSMMASALVMFGTSSIFFYRGGTTNNSSTNNNGVIDDNTNVDVHYLLLTTSTRMPEKKHHHHPDYPKEYYHSLRHQNDDSLLSVSSFLPVLPNMNANSSTTTKAPVAAAADAQSFQAMASLFRLAISPKSGGGWIDLHPQGMDYHQVDKLRTIAQTIQRQELACGHPTVTVLPPPQHHSNSASSSTAITIIDTASSTSSSSSNLTFCFWDSDIVSNRALQNFSYETVLWQWVIQEFQSLQRELEIQQQKQQYGSDDPSSLSSLLGFLDIGVNVGDWAVPIRLALPQVPYFGIEGAPATAALAMANMRTANEYHLRSGHGLVLAPMAMLPFSLVSKRMIRHMQQRQQQRRQRQNGNSSSSGSSSDNNGGGGVCFQRLPGNVGGQGVRLSMNKDEVCQPAVTAGATLLPHALRAAVPLQQQQQQQLQHAQQERQQHQQLHSLSAASDASSSSSSSSSSTLRFHDWPRFYIAKVDIERFEFKVLNSAMDWLIERPPCYLLVEVVKQPHVSALIELLLDVGYDALWRTHNTFAQNESFRHDEFPRHSPPYWSRSQNATITIHHAIAEDLRHNCCYKDYLFGFEDRTSCLRTLLES